METHLNFRNFKPSEQVKDLNPPSTDRNLHDHDISYLSNNALVLDLNTNEFIGEEEDVSAPNRF